MTFLRNGLLAAAAVGALSLGSAGNANATAYGYSFMEVSSLTASFTDGATAFGFGGSFSFVGDTGATLTGFAPDGDSDSKLAPFSCDGPGGCPGGPVDPLQAFLGAGGPNPGENSFGQVGDSGPSYARADHLLSDTLVNTAAGAPAGGGGDWEGVAETAVSGALVGTGSSGNNQSWDFAVGDLPDGTDVSIEFDLDALLEVSTDVAGEASSASIAITFTMEGKDAGGDVVELRTRLINLTTSRINPGTTTLDEGDLDFSEVVGISIDGSGHVTVTITNLDADGADEADYEFRIAVNNDASAESVERVPEPFTLGLMGLGLLGVGAMARRRRA